MSVLPRSESFTLFAARGRVYARNVRGKVIDLGRLACEHGAWAAEIDGSHDRIAPQPSALAALDAVAERLTFLFLDGQFTALADLAGDGRPDLEQAPQRELALEPPGPAQAAPATG